MSHTEIPWPAPRRGRIWRPASPGLTWPGARVPARRLLVVNYEEGSELAARRWHWPSAPSARCPKWPRCPGLEGRRDLAMESMLEYGARCGFLALDGYFRPAFQVKSTFYACAVALERTREAARLILDKKGYDVVAHGYRWEDVRC